MSSTQTNSQINRVFEERKTNELADKMGLKYINISQFLLNPDHLKFLPEEVAKANHIIPFDVQQKKLLLATSRPNNKNIQIICQRFKEQKGYECEIYICSESGLNSVFSWYQSDIVQKKKVETSDKVDEEKSGFSENKKSIENLQLKMGEIPIEESLNELLLLGVKLRTSDIHLQPYKDTINIRFRIDGILHDILEIKNEVAGKLISRIKYEGGMHLNIDDHPQDGRFDFSANDRKVDVRVSSIPTEYLESVVLRLLDSYKSLKNFEELGFSKSKVETLNNILNHRTGMILVTGPTGSGKTTTLYTMMEQLNQPDKKVVTLEDPIEYHVDNVTQSQVSLDGNYTFENGLKAILRHDPDVILIGEIRTESTAKLASEASQTGHLVLSSVHTNSAIGTVSRLRNLDLENFNITSSVRAIIAQRLVRKLCPHCKQEIIWNPSTKEAHNLEQKLPKKLPKAIGCEKCSSTGYQGRIVINEILELDYNLKQRILRGDSESDLKLFLQHQNFQTLFDAGIELVKKGETTLEEIYRVAL